MKKKFRIHDQLLSFKTASKSTRTTKSSAAQHVSRVLKPVSERIRADLQVETLRFIFYRRFREEIQKLRLEPERQDGASRLIYS